MTVIPTPGLARNVLELDECAPGVEADRLRDRVFAIRGGRTVAPSETSAPRE
jgi:hypothetical protein